VDKKDEFIEFLLESPILSQRIGRAMEELSEDEGIDEFWETSPDISEMVEIMDWLTVRGGLSGYYRERAEEITTILENHEDPEKVKDLAWGSEVEQIYDRRARRSRSGSCCE